MTDPDSPDATPVDLDAFRARRHAQNAAETAGRLLHAQLVAEADAALGAALAAEQDEQLHAAIDAGLGDPEVDVTVEWLAEVVNRHLGDSIDDLAFAALVDDLFVICEDERRGGV